MKPITIDLNSFIPVSAAKERILEPKKKRGKIDITFMVLVLILLTFGLVMLFSASYAYAFYNKGDSFYYIERQLMFAIMGVVAMLAISQVNYKILQKYSLLLFAGTLCLLVIVLFMRDKDGFARWIYIGNILSFQPSEIAKIGVILSFAVLICNNRGRMKTFRYGILPFVAILLVIVGLLVLEPHFSASIIIIAIGGVMIFLGGARLIWFIAAAVAAGGGIAVLLTMFPYASGRITTWLDPFSSTSDEGYQIVQSLYSIGSGGLTGLGLGQSRQKYLYLPEEHNDFIFSVVCEELGFIGALLILALFALLIIRGYWLAMHAADRYGFLVGAGITTLLAIQVILNVAVVTNLVPCTGISLPFFSYGGTALLIQMAQMGIVLSMSRDIPAKRAG